MSGLAPDPNGRPHGPLADDDLLPMLSVAVRCGMARRPSLVAPVHWSGDPPLAFVQIQAGYFVFVCARIADVQK